MSAQAAVGFDPSVVGEYETLCELPEANNIALIIETWSEFSPIMESLMRETSAAVEQARVKAAKSALTVEALSDAVTNEALKTLASGMEKLLPKVVEAELKSANLQTLKEVQKRKRMYASAKFRADILRWAYRSLKQWMVEESLQSPA